MQIVPIPQKWWGMEDGFRLAHLAIYIYIYIYIYPLFYLYFKNTHRILTHLSYQVLTYLDIKTLLIVLLNTLVHIVKLLRKN